MRVNFSFALIAGLTISTCAFAVPILNLNNHAISTIGSDKSASNYNMAAESYIKTTSRHSVDDTSDKGIITNTSGFDARHFDMAAYKRDLVGGNSIILKGDWSLNSDSQDLSSMPKAQVVPAPGALLLGAIGAGIVGWLRQRKSI